jgi:hypothetical protein
MLLENITTAPKCYCGEFVMFMAKIKLNIFGGWKQYCSRKCMTNSTDVIFKRKSTTKERFGVESYSQIQVFHKKTEEVKKIAKEKALITYREKYGYDHSSQSPLTREKVVKTSLERFGVENCLVLVDPKNAKPWFITNEGKEYLKNRIISPETIRKTLYNKIIKRNKVKDPAMAKILSEWDSSSFKAYVDKIALEICPEIHSRKKIADNIGLSLEYIHILYNKHGLHGDKYKAPSGSSEGEREVRDYIVELGMYVQEHSKKSIIGDGKEIDIYIPDRKLAIEYNGVTWHSEGRTGRDKSYHLSKTNGCEYKNIQLLQIYDVEWNDAIKQKIWKSIIKAKLGLIQNKIFARKCETRKISAAESRIFLDLNHISGFVGAKEHFGLFYNNELVSVMSFGKSRFADEYEIIRHASLIDHIVVGGLSKLLRCYSYDKPLVTYADRRFSSLLKSSYTNICKKYEITPPSWKGYNINEYRLKHRLSFTKNKMKNILKELYNENLSVFQNMVENKYDRIWDSGNIKYYLK